jgi:hypothetical protein
MIQPKKELLDLPLQERIELAMNATFEDVVEEHRRAGLPIAILGDGKVVEVSPDELMALRNAKKHAANGTPNGQ